MSKKLGKLIKPFARGISFYTNPFKWLKVPAKVRSYERFPHTLLKEAEEVELQLPTASLPFLAQEFRESQPFKTAPAFFLELQDGVTSHLGVSMSSRGDVIAEAAENFVVPTPDQHPIFHFKWRRLKEPILKEPQSVLSLAAECHDNYYHWLYDVLPRLHLAELAGAKIEKLYTPLCRSFHIETLQLLGYSKSDCIDADTVAAVESENLQVASFPLYWRGERVILPKWVCDWLRKRFLPVCTPPTTGGRKIYISRRDASYRFVTNEDEIVEYLRAQGFEVVTLTGMSVLKQVQLFQSADIIVAPHGAGLTNLVFCREGTRVIEAFYPGFACPSYWHVAAQVGLKYYCLLGKEREMAPEARPYADMDINLDNLKTILAQLG